MDPWTQLHQCLSTLLLPTTVENSFMSCAVSMQGANLNGALVVKVGRVANSSLLHHTV